MDGSDSTSDQVIEKIIKIVKDGAYFCYCAYVLRISRYSDFLWVVPTNYTGIFFARFKTLVRKQNSASAAGIQKENWGQPCIFFSEIIKLQYGKRRHTLLCILRLFRITVA